MTLSTRCPWAKNELAIHYHDTEWGVPLYDDQRLFEFLLLEGAQAGLSWDTVLKKREAYRIAFDGFDPQIVSRYNEAKIADLLANSGIIRNRLKIASAISNAKAFLDIQSEFGSFSEWIWSFVNGKPIINHYQVLSDIPSTLPLSDKLSKALKKRGFRFVGSTICYAHMQATGMVNDHLVTCFRHQAVQQLSK